jgi:hypothetical protein
MQKRVDRKMMDPRHCGDRRFYSLSMRNEIRVDELIFIQPCFCHKITEDGSFPVSARAIIHERDLMTG